MSVALRVSQEVGTQIGSLVGYIVRFENATSKSTRIIYLTDGMLFRETLSDPLLTKYNVIMVIFHSNLRSTKVF